MDEFRSECCSVDGEVPTYRITHWKAGSQWVQGVLTELAADRLYVPAMDVSDGRAEEPPFPGRIYTPMYLNRLRFEESCFGRSAHRKFVVIRDLRDTLVSWYFSLLKTHDENPEVLRHRARLRELDQESGLRYLIEHDDLFGLSMIHSTWMEAEDVLVIRFERLIEDPEGCFAAILEQCGIDAPAESLRMALSNRSLEALAGRKRGTDGESHYRRGIAGDWERYFTPQLRYEFSTRYDDLQIKNGYGGCAV